MFDEIVIFLLIFIKFSPIFFFFLSFCSIPIEVDYFVYIFSNYICVVYSYVFLLYHIHYSFVGIIFFLNKYCYI